MLSLFNRIQALLISRQGFKNIPLVKFFTIVYACFAGFKKTWRKSLLHEEKLKRKFDFVECYAIWLKDDVCSVTNIGEY